MKILSLTRNDLNIPSKNMDIVDIEYYNFKVELKKIAEAEKVIFTDDDGTTFKVLKDRYAIHTKPNQ